MEEQRLKSMCYFKAPDKAVDILWDGVVSKNPI